MNRLTLYNHALSILDMKIDDLENPTKELNLLNLNYQTVVSFCLRAWEFPFLIKRAALTEIEKEDGKQVTWNGFKYGYTPPDDLGRIVQLNGDRKHRYAHRFGLIWSDILNPEVEYLPSRLSVDTEGNYTAPDEFMALVAYQLALHIAPMLDPNGTAVSIAAQMYQLTLASIIESETRGNDREQNFGATPYWGDGELITQGDLRNGIISGSI